MKRCRTCHTDKPERQFHRHRLSGWRHDCRECLGYPLKPEPDLPKHIISGAIYRGLELLCTGCTTETLDREVYVSLMRFVMKSTDMEKAYMYAKAAGLMKDIDSKLHKWHSIKAHRSYQDFVDNYER